MMRRLHLAAVLIAAVLPAGCATPSSTATPEGRAAGTPSSLDAVLDQAGLRKVSDASGRDAAGRLRVGVVIQNPTDERRAVRWRIDWLDRAGFAMASQPATRGTLILRPLATDSIDVTAADARIADYRLTVEVDR